MNHAWIFPCPNHARIGPVSGTKFRARVTRARIGHGIRARIGPGYLATRARIGPEIPGTNHAWEYLGPNFLAQNQVRECPFAIDA